MTQREDGIDTAIQHVREELARSREPDDPTRVRIEAALREIREALREERPGPAPESSRDALFESMEHFAEEHPALSASLGRLVDILAKMGI